MLLLMGQGAGQPGRWCQASALRAWLWMWRCNGGYLQLSCTELPTFLRYDQQLAFVLQVNAVSHVQAFATDVQGPQQQQQPWQSSSLQESMHLRKWRPATVSAAHEAPSPSVREQADSKTVHDAAALIRVVAASMMHNQASSSPANCLAVDLAAVEPEKLSPPLPSQSAPSDDNVSLAVNGAAPAPVVGGSCRHRASCWICCMTFKSGDCQACLMLMNR